MPIVEFNEVVQPGLTLGFRGNIDPAFNPMFAKRLRGEVIEQFWKGQARVYLVKVERAVLEVPAERCKVVKDAQRG